MVVEECAGEGVPGVVFFADEGTCTVVDSAVGPGVILVDIGSSVVDEGK